MPELQVVEALMTSVGENVKAKFDKSKLQFVNKFEGRANQIAQDTFTWINSDEDYGTSPIVSSMQNSPVVGQGNYSQYRASGIETRHVKAFTRDQLQAILSPDAKYRISATDHIARESANQLARVYTTMELVAQSCTSRGTLKYTSNDPANRMKVDLTFPIKTKTAGVLWNHLTSTTLDADIVGDVQDWLDEQVLAGQGKPDAIRMTTKVWRYIRDNNDIKTRINTMLRMNPSELTTNGGLVTPKLVCDAFGWPPIEIYDERAALKFTAAATVSSGSTKTITLNEGTFGLFVGEKILIRYADGSWDDEATITTVTDGVSIVVDALAAQLTAGDIVVSKPTYFPNNVIKFVTDEDRDTELVRCPFGIEQNAGQISLPNWYGVRIDSFASGSEPNLTVFKRIWDKFGIRFNPYKVMVCRVL